MPDPFPPTYYVDYLNTPEVQEAIGAYVNYSESNAAVGAAFANTGDDDREIGTVAAVKRILDSNVTLIMYFGDADYNCNWLGGQVIADHVNATGYTDAGFVNITSSDHVVHGQVKQAGTFAFVRVSTPSPFFIPPEPHHSTADIYPSDIRIRPRSPLLQTPCLSRVLRQSSQWL